jgi:SulP family sulfate permease
VGITLASLFLTPALYYLPQATLGGDHHRGRAVAGGPAPCSRSTWAFSEAGLTAPWHATLLATLLLGVESGLVIGVAAVATACFFCCMRSRPHVPALGLMPGTKHFAATCRATRSASAPVCCVLPVDASMFFANPRAIEDRINAEVASRAGAGPCAAAMLGGE